MSRSVPRFCMRLTPATPRTAAVACRPDMPGAILLLRLGLPAPDDGDKHCRNRVCCGGQAGRASKCKQRLRLLTPEKGQKSMDGSRHHQPKTDVVVAIVRIVDVPVPVPGGRIVIVVVPRTATKNVSGLPDPHTGG